MCKTFSAFVTRHGDLLRDDATDSHNDIAELFNLRDNGHNAVPVEFYPENVEDMDKPEKYALRVDAEIPPWWDEVKVQVKEKFRAVIERKMVRGEVKILPAGVYVLTEGANVGMCLCGARIVWAAKGATIKDAGYATIQYAGYATIQNAGHATIQYAWYATIQNAGNATIQHAWHATIQNAGHATIVNKQYAKIL